MINELNKVVPYIKNRECIFFIGAGLSTIAGLYDWNSFVTKLFMHPDIKRIHNPDKIAKSRLSHPELVELGYRTLKDIKKTNEFWNIVRAGLLLKNPKMFTDNYLPVIQNIKKIKPFPTTIITTNVDNCLEEARIIKSDKVFYRSDEFTLNNLNNEGIFHIHGYIEQLENALLFESKYLERYQDNNFREFLKEIFREYSVLFLGYSLKDRKLLEIIFQHDKKINKDHFALVSEGEFNAFDREAFLRLYQIKIIECGCKDNILNVFTNWIDREFIKVSA